MDGKPAVIKRSRLGSRSYSTRLGSRSYGGCGYNTESRLGSRSYKTRDYKTGHGWEAVPTVAAAEAVPTGVVVIIQSRGWEAVPTRPAVIKRVATRWVAAGSRSYKVILKNCPKFSNML